MSITDVPLPGWCFIEAFSPWFAEFTSQPSLAGEERETPRPRCRERGDGPSRAHSPAGQAAPPGDQHELLASMVPTGHTAQRK